MSRTIQEVKDNLELSKQRTQALIDQANATTGKTDTDLTSAVGALVEGFGQGGSVEGLAYDMGEFVLDSDTLNIANLEGGITHKLGVVPRFIIIWTDDFSDLSEDNLSPYSTTTNIGYIFIQGITGLLQRLTSAVNYDNGVYISSTLAQNAYSADWKAPTSKTYTIEKNNSCYAPTEDKIFLPKQGSTYYWRAGVKYKYFVSRNWWEVFDNVE